MNRIIWILLVLITNYSAFCQDGWIQREDFPGVGRWYPVGFALDNAVYIGLNSGGGDFYKFDLQSNEWSKTSQIPGVDKQGSYSFAFDSVGIIVGGCCYSTEVWKYSPLNDTWTQLNAFPGNIKSYGVSWSYNSYGYICTGWGGDYKPSKEFWKYDQKNDSWTQLPDFPGFERGWAVGFQIGTKGYIGTGAKKTGFSVDAEYYDDFWEYDMTNNQWKQLSNFPGSARIGMVGFNLGNYGYFGTGNKTSSSPMQDFWKFDPSNGTWEQKSDFSGGPLTLGIGISNGKRGFIGLGIDGSNYPKFFWEYTTDTLTNIINIPIKNSKVDVFPNPTKSFSTLTFSNDIIRINIMDKMGRKLYSTQSIKGRKHFKIDLQNYSPGIYLIEFIDVNNRSIMKKFIKI